MQKPKNLICMAHRHELRGRMQVGGRCRAKETTWGKWDNCNSIIKIHFLKNEGDIRGESVSIESTVHSCGY